MNKTNYPEKLLMAANQNVTERNYWLENLAGEPARTFFPYDYKLKPGNHRKMEEFPFEISAEESLKLAKLSKNSDTRLNMILVTAVSILLSRYTGNTDVTLCAPIYRQEMDVDFINTLLLLRCDIQPVTTFKQLLLTSRETISQATKHYSYPMEMLLDELGMPFGGEGLSAISDVVCMLDTIHDAGYIRQLSKHINFVITFSNRDGKVSGIIRYNSILYKEQTIAAISRHLQKILNQVLLHNIDTAVSEIPLLSDAERQHLLVEFNAPQADYPREKLLHQLFQEQVERFPDNPALIFEASSCTYQELNHQSNRFSHFLTARLVAAIHESHILAQSPPSHSSHSSHSSYSSPSHETPIALLLDPSIDMIAAILGILKSGGAYLPIDPHAPQDRLSSILEDSRAPVLLTTSAIRDRYPILKEQSIGCNIVLLDDVDALLSDQPIHNPQQVGDSSSLAYIIFTSGSTGKPKGAMIEHRNVVSLMANCESLFDFDHTDVWTMFHSYSFDFSVWEMYGALLQGAQLIIIPKMAAKDPGLYRQIVKDKGVTVLNQTPSAFYNFIDEELKQPENTLNLKYVIFGGEALAPGKLEQWHNRYPDTKLINMFGITETTVHVTFKEITNVEILQNISNIGVPIPTLSTYILGKNLELLPMAVPGELTVGGAGVTRGYLNRPQLTSGKFVNNPHVDGERLYRSGDLARMSHAGQMEYIGRIDNQVQLRGFRIELGEIEAQLIKHEHIKDALVLARKEAQEETYLCGYIVTLNQLTVAEIREFLTLSLPDYMIPLYFVQVDKFPLTPNGKIDRRALPEPQMESGDEYVAPRNHDEEKMVTLWRNILEVERIGIRDDYFNIGGDSIKAIKLLGAVNDAFGCDLKIPDLYENETIEKLCAKMILSAAGPESHAVEEAFTELEQLKERIIKAHDIPEGIEDIYPMSDIEKGMVFAFLMNPGEGVYHDQFVFPMKYKDFDGGTYNNAFKMMVEKHSILRISYHIGQYEDDVRFVHETVDQGVELHDLRHKSKERQEETINGIMQESRKNSFDVTRAPLWRMRAFELGNDQIMVVWEFHHAILDGWSNASFMTELNNTYMQLKSDHTYRLGTLQNSYKSFIAQQIVERNDQKIIKFWQDDLADYKRLDFSRLNPDHEKGLEKGIEKGHEKEPGISKKYLLQLGTSLLDKLRSSVQSHHLTLKSVCFAAYTYMLHMISYETDLTVGLVTNNRPVCEDGDRILGCFLNSVPLRVNISRNQSWLDYAAQVEAKLLDMKKYDRLSLLEIANITAEATDGGNPFFDTFFNFVDFHIYNNVSADNTSYQKGVDMSQYMDVSGHEKTEALFDMSVNTTFGIFEIVFSYNTALMNQETVEQLGGYLQEFFNRFLEEPKSPARKESLFSPSQKKKLLYDFNDTKYDYPRDKTLNRLFELQVEKTPENVALVFEEQRLTYAGLNKKANQLARVIRGKGVTPDTIVGLITGRSMHMMVAMLAVLKAGGAYLPIDADYPTDRVRYMLKDSASTLALTQENLLPEYQTDQCDALDIEDHKYYNGADENLESVTTPQHLAYVIYTSGSTGKPKGVMIEHRPVANFIAGMCQYLHIIDHDNLLSLTTISFDIYGLETYVPLTKGATVVLGNREQQVNISAIVPVIEKEKINILQVTPSRLQIMAQDPYIKNILQPLRLLLVGGEAFPAPLLEKVKSILPDHTKLWNMYGPTETTIWSAIKELSGDNVLTIGKPIANTGIYILDRNDAIQPPGIAGELCISGDGLARGYVNRFQLSKEKFFHHPYVSTRMYRTGDLAMWLPGGELEFLGRIDYQVKVRGYRIELGEIENVLSQYETVMDVVVIDRADAHGDRYLCAYIVASQEIIPSDLRDHLSKSVPEYMVPSYFVPMENIPLTPNGKVNRKALPEPEAGAMAVTAEVVAATNPVEAKLVEIWSNVLGMEKESIGIDTGFFEMGGNSIRIMRISSEVSRAFQCEISISDFMKANTIRHLGAYISDEGKRSGTAAYPAAQPDPNKKYESFPITDVQMAYLMGRSSHLEMGGVSTHAYFETRTPIQLARISAALDQVIMRHPMLRAVINEDGRQQIQEGITGYGIQSEDLSHMTETQQDERIAQERERMSHYMFKPEQWPLFEIKAFIMDDETTHLCVGIDLLISDAFSVRIIMMEFMQYYADPDLQLPPLEFTFRDYMLAHEELKNSSIYTGDRDYWLGKLETFPSAPALPLRCNPADIEQPHFKGHKKIFDNSQWKKLKQVAQQHNITPSTLLLAAYADLLAFWSNQPRLAINLTVFNRYPFHPDVERIVGDFTSLILVGVELEANASFGEKARSVGKTLFEGLAHRHYDGVEFIRELGKDRDMTNKAVMPIVFTSALFDEADAGAPIEKNAEAADEDFGSIQTSQVYIDNMVSEANGQLTINWSYVDELFQPEMIDTMFSQYIELLTALMEARNTDGIITLPANQQRMVDLMNRTAEDIPTHTLDFLFMEQVQRTPDNIAVQYGDERISYKELDEESNRAAHFLQQQGVVTNDMVSILTPRIIDTMVYVIAILKTGGSYVPIEPDYPQDRRDYIKNNSKSRFLVDPASYDKNHLDTFPEEPVSYDAVKEDIAYVIFTSGSTGRPKGVVITHHEAANTIIDINRKFNVTEIDSILAISSMCFDLSVYDVFGAFSTGARLELIPTQKDVDVLIGTLTNKEITFWNSVPAIMDLVVDNLEADYINPHLKSVLMSGDWIPVTLPDKIKFHFPNAFVSSLGGATEGSIWSIWYPIEEVKKEWTAIPYGVPIANQNFYVLNYQLEHCPVGVSGELFIGGEGVAEGYLNDVDKSFYSFIQHPTLGYLYRTGDHGVYNANGYIEFLGRKDNQVKIRGYRVELGEIEACLLEDSGVKSAVVVDRLGPLKKKYLAAYIVSNENSEADVQALRSYLSAKLPDYMVPTYFVLLDEIPLTANRKVDRKALPDPQQDGSAGTISHAAAETETQRQLLNIWQEILSLDNVGITDNFFEIGGDSLKTITLVSRIHKAFEVKIPLTRIYSMPTVQELAESIDLSNRAKYVEIPLAPQQPHYPLSSAQRRIYILQQMDLNRMEYNLPSAMVLEGDVDRHKLEGAFKQLIQRHESLRTSFIAVDDDYFQDVHDYAAFSVEYFEMEEALEMETIVKFVRPFNLEQAPLFRVGLSRTIDVNNRHVMMFDMHHIISDGVSMEIFAREFMHLYAGQTLEPVKLQYKDFSQWRNTQAEIEAVARQEQYWLKQFQGEIPQLNLPTDFVRPAVRSIEGKRIDFHLDAKLTESLKQLALDERTTLYTVLLSVFDIFLAKIALQQEITVGTPVAGRRHADLQGIIGMFVNMLVIPAHVNETDSFTKLLRQTKMKTTAAFENQDYQYEELVDKVGVVRDTARNPLFDATFVLQTMDVSEFELSGITLKAYPQKRTTSKFDLTLEAVETDTDILLEMEYCTDLFKEENIRRFIGFFKRIAAMVATDPYQLISHMDIIADEEREQILHQFNDTAHDYPNEKSFTQLFQTQVEQTPHKLAVALHGSEKLSYGQLNTKSNLLALYLRKQGMTANRIGGVMVERSTQMVVAVLAILKAGGAYVPIDPNLPLQRKEFILKDVAAQVLLSQSPITESFKESQTADSVELIHLDTFEYGADDPGNPETINCSQDPAYTIYTSGTTGKPKGVLIEHRSLVNLCYWHNRVFQVTENDNAALYANYSFDASVWELFPYLIKGASLHVVPEEMKLELERLNQFYQENNITITFLPTPVAEQFMQLENSSLRILLTGGDKLNRFEAKSYQLINNYGPTENTVVATSMPISGVTANLPIGSAVDNSVVYVVDRNQRILPVGIAGELVAGGDNIARGYLNNPELTHQKFYNNDGTRLYRTGDRCRWLPDGTIEFLGRQDTQVKIRGFRVEPKEIERLILDHEPVSEVLVVPRENKSGEKFLCAYLVTSQADETGIQVLKDRLAARLPAFMVPSVFVPLESFPLTPNGKIDHRALPEPDAAEGGTEFVAPGNAVETDIADIWKEILGLQQVGVNDNLFEIGGNSLNAIKINKRLNQHFNKNLPVVTLFTYPTIAKLARYMEQVDKENNEPQKKRTEELDRGKDKLKRMKRKRKK